MIKQAFNTAEAKPEGSSSNDFVAAILRERPDLQGERACSFHDQGFCSYTVFIGDEVFKTPNGARFAGKFDHELQVLQTMQGKGLPVPEVTHVSKEAQFFGMKKMPGAPLALGFFINRPEEEQRRLAKDIAQFVVDMAALFPLKENGKFMTHGDLHVGNVMIDTTTRKLSGILDFGLAAYVGETEVRPSAAPDVNDWRPCLRAVSDKPHEKEKLQEFNEMLHEEYLAVRKTAPSAAVKPASPFNP